MQTSTTPDCMTPDPADVAIALVEARRYRRGRWWVAGGIVSLFVGYPLSLVSVIVLDHHGLVPVALYLILRFIHSPLIYAFETVPIVNDLLRSYLKFLGINL